MAEFSRYKAKAGIQIETQPGSRGLVLRNLVGIASKREMDRREAQALASAQERSFDSITSQTTFNASILRSMHRDWLSGLYEWAGKYRDVELAKGSFRWPPARFVPTSMAEFEQNTLKRLSPCTPRPMEEVCRSISEVHGELLLIHPFRDGNGRLSRWLAGLMALPAGLPKPDYNFVGRGAQASRARYLEGVVKAYSTNYAPLAAFFEDAFARAFARLARAGLGNP